MARSVLLAVIIAALAISQTNPAGAKTTLSISPTSGSANATITVSGDGFGGDPVKIGLFPSGALAALPRTGGGLLIDALVDDNFVVLATVTPRDSAFVVDVTLSPNEIAARKYGSGVDIVAEEPARGATFVTAQTFTFTSQALAQTGAGGLRRAGLPITTLSVSLAAAGAILVAASHCLRRVR